MTARDSEKDAALAVSEDYVQSPVHKASSTTSIDFDGLLQPDLRLHQNLANGTRRHSQQRNLQNLIVVRQWRTSLACGHGTSKVYLANQTRIA